jgi:adenine C2-methylase RlmN of 23S rRNA A2503 and tRNA A37
MKFFFDYERPELAGMFKPPYRATQIYKSVYQRQFEDFHLMTDLPKALRAELADARRSPPIRLRRRNTTLSGTTR